MDNNSGSVILVGAGPGDPGLITMRGREAIADAQVVLYDRLVGDGILAMIPESAEAIDVGKSAGDHPVPQHEINALILEHVQRGKRVVRLKGGDPYLFGRGAEELEGVVAEGIPFEVVPGVTSAVAVPAYGGIPVSHRDMASSVHIITGHARRGAEVAINYSALAALNGTLVFLMGVGSLGEIAAGLTGAGMAATTPCALVENGTRPSQRRLTATLADIEAKAKAEGFRPPSVLVVGQVCTLTAELDWFTRRPLHGATVLVTRPKASAGTLCGKLRALGAGVVEYPCIRTVPLPVVRSVYDDAAAAHWLVFTSPAGVRQFFAAMGELGKDIRLLVNTKLAAVGAKTAAELSARGMLPALVPETFNATALAESMLEQTQPGERVLLYRAEAGTPTLAQTLREGGCEVADIAAYSTVYEDPSAGAVAGQLAAGRIDYVTFTSASTVEGFVRSLPEADYTAYTAVCIGQETAAAAQGHGMKVIVSESATIDSMAERILAHRRGEE